MAIHARAMEQMKTNWRLQIGHASLLKLGLNLSKKVGYLGFLFFFFKQQVVMSIVADSILSASIGMQTPTVFLPFLNRFTDILVAPNFNTFIFLQRTFT